ncbi:MAG: hypothetical protein [Circular genetic element sp.]|nr:MAG: hypothetical protein [Circular genetic element sp.]
MLYRFHFDCDSFPFTDWPQLRATIFKDVGEFKLVVLEVSKEVKKRHYQGVVSIETPKTTLESRVKKSKVPGSPRGCYSLTIQKPTGVEGYYNYLCKGDSYESPPEVLQSIFDEAELEARHQKYHKKEMDTSELLKKAKAIVAKQDDSFLHYETKMCDRGKEGEIDSTPHTQGLWRQIFHACLEYMMETSPNGFIQSQVERLAFKTLTHLIQSNDNPESIVTELPQLISYKRANAFI